jgi:non-specific protein-tyrosine kinase
MDSSSFSDDIRHYLGLLWHWAWLLVLATVLAGAAAFFASQQLTPIYQATTTVLISEAPGTKTTDYTSLVANERLAQTYSQLMLKTPALQGVIDMLGLQTDPRSLVTAIQVQPVRDTQLIDVRVENPNPQLATDIANALVKVFADQISQTQAARYEVSKNSLNEQLNNIDSQLKANTDALAALADTPENKEERKDLEALQANLRTTYVYLMQSFEQVRLAEAQSTASVTQVDPATVPTNPVRPRVLTNTILMALVGLALAIGAVFVVEAMDDTLRSPDDVSRQLDLPVLGLIASHEAIDGKPVTMTQPRSPVAEAFRSLRTNMQFASVDQPLHTVLVTSPTPEDGKSTIATNLAVILAQSGNKVAIIDADLRRPRVHKVVGLPNRQGISNLFVQSQVSLNGTLQQTDLAGLMVMTSGSLPPNPAELLGSEKMFDILYQVKESADLIVLDSPPVLAVTDAVVLAPRVDGVLLVVKPGKTKMLACRQAVEQLRRVGANVLGVVLNDVEVRRSRYNYKYNYYKGYYYSYHKYYGPSEPEKTKA